jgi:hypothetical protein
MNTGLLAGILGGVIGVAGGVIGTYFSIKNTRSSAERAFVARCAVGTWIGVLAFLALLLLVPSSFRWLLWVPYGIGLALAVRWMNETQARIREAADSRGRSGLTSASSEFNRLRWFVPRFSGRMRFAHVPGDFAPRLQKRVEDGFLVRGVRTRANYSIHTDAGEVRIVANDYWTAINIGLNDVRLRSADEQHVAYEVTFWRWTVYGLLLGGSILALLLGCTLTIESVSAYFPVDPLARAGTWSIAIFFGLVWPWVLTEMHKRPAAQCLDRILRETLLNIREESS